MIPCDKESGAAMHVNCKNTIKINKNTFSKVNLSVHADKNVSEA